MAQAPERKDAVITQPMSLFDVSAINYIQSKPKFGYQYYIKLSCPCNQAPKREETYQPEGNRLIVLWRKLAWLVVRPDWQQVWLHHRCDLARPFHRDQGVVEHGPQNMHSSIGDRFPALRLLGLKLQTVAEDRRTWV